MRKLVIYYSFEGNTKLMAESIAKAVDADLLQLIPKRKNSFKGFLRYLRAGKEAMTRKKPELLPLDKNPEDYDLLFIGTPVWAGSCASPMNSFLSSYPVTDKKIAFFCCHAGGKGKILEKMREALKGNEFIGEIDFKNPLKHDTEKNITKAEDWATKMSMPSSGESAAEPDLLSSAGL
jgi:flavodoxin